MITINFAGRQYRLFGRIRAGLIAGSVVLCIVLAGLIWTTVSLRENMSALDRKLKEAGAADEQVRPLFSERGRIIKDLTAMSGLLDSKKLSWTLLLTSIEAVVPRGVALTHMEFHAKERTVTLDGMAQSPEALRTLVMGLEKSPSFKDPFLKHQSLEKGNISFNVIAVY